MKPRTRLQLAAACLATTVVGSALGALPSGWDAVRATVAVGDLAGPIDFAIAPDGAIWTVEFYTGNVTRIDPATGTREVKFNADPIPRPVERGLVGFALDPGVVQNGVFYVYYTILDPDDPDNGTNRLARVAGGEETVLLSLTANMLHNGGKIVFAPDGSMFVSTGDNNRKLAAQDPDSLLGKVLHLMPDGSPAPGNLRGYVYSVGHRNVYGLAVDPRTGLVYETENSNAERDEVNRIEAGQNYGWPHCEGFHRYDFQFERATNEPCDETKYRPPLAVFYDNRTAAPTAITFFRGAIYWASWNEGAIHHLYADPAGTWLDEVAHNPPGRIHDLEPGLDGNSLYYSNWTSIVRLEFPSIEPDEGVPGALPAAGRPASTPAPGLLLVVLAFAGVGAVRRRLVDGRLLRDRRRRGS